MKKSQVGVAVVLPPLKSRQKQGWQYNCHPNNLFTAGGGCATFYHRLTAGQQNARTAGGHVDFDLATHPAETRA